MNTAAPGNELEGATIHLEQRSYCSPTRGEYEAVTGVDGYFEFPVYLHDTDSFSVEAAVDGYQPVQLRFGGFDCLFCACPPLKIIVQPAGIDGQSWSGNTTADGLATDFVSAIAIAPDGAVWFGTQAEPGGRGGVSRFDGEAWTSYIW